MTRQRARDVMSVDVLTLRYVTYVSHTLAPYSRSDNDILQSHDDMVDQLDTDIGVDNRHQTYQTYTLYQHTHTHTHMHTLYQRWQLISSISDVKYHVCRYWTNSEIKTLLSNNRKRQRR